MGLRENRSSTKVSPIEVCPTSGPEMLDDPMDPEWILEGEPRARSGWWAGTSDALDNNYVWDCTAGRFRWYFGCDEIVHVIEGEVQVSGDGVAETWLRAGDAALFRSGTWAVWYVPTYVRKHAVLHRKLPTPLRALIGLARRAKHLLDRVRGHGASAPVDTPARML